MPGRELGTASTLKIQVAQILGSEKAGRVISALGRNRIRHQGLWFDVRSSDFSPSARARMFWGFYEGTETRMIRTFLRDSTTVVELGSSLGVTTAHMASLMAPGGHLVCVEANPRLIEGLRERTVARFPSLQVDVIHAAISGHCGISELVLADQTVGSHVGPGRRGESTVTVPALTLRGVLSQTGVAEFDLVSDIEGAESTFLMGDPSVLDKCERAVIELHDTTLNDQRVSVFELVDVAIAQGFRLVGRHGPVIALSRR